MLHQLDVVRQIVGHAEAIGARVNGAVRYRLPPLLQHSVRIRLHPRFVLPSLHQCFVQKPVQDLQRPFLGHNVRAEMVSQKLHAGIYASVYEAPELLQLFDIREPVLVVRPGVGFSLQEKHSQPLEFDLVPHCCQAPQMGLGTLGLGT